MADAVRMSVSIPLYFSALRYNEDGFGDGEFYVDGGVFNNFPIQLFDGIEFAKTIPGISTASTMKPWDSSSIKRCSGDE